MNFAWSYFFVLIWLAYMISTGVLLFSRGFLLSRVSKTNVSHCRRLSTNTSEQFHITEQLAQEILKDVNATSDICLPQKSKVIILVIDALKYEFGVFKENHTNPLPFENRMPLLHELLQNEPQQSRLMRFKADPPTTTLQRLKGLTTGSLPTFIDIGSNFASPEINEDNIIDQMINNNLSVVFLGDSTWVDLYPRRFKRTFAYPSFDIFDLDTVDRKIEKHLPREIAKTDWQVLIAHFLGVDHCGHKYGPLHVEMARKLKEMNDVIRSVIDQMDNDTTLLVMGDHGMTVTGDHGGDTDDETNALLFAYSKQTPFVNSTYSTEDEILQQIDIVPTLSTILGIPIPYSNLGLVNFNLVPDVALPYISRHQTLLMHAWQNAQQIYTYFYNYALENKRTFNVDQLDNMETEFILLMHRVKTIYNDAAYKSFICDLNPQLRKILSTCRNIWVKFDATQMSQGLLMTFVPIFFAFLLINNCQPTDFYRIFTPREVFYTYLLNMAAGVFGYRYYKHFAYKTELQGIIFFTNIVSTLVLVYHTVQHWSTVSENWSRMRRFSNMPTRVVLLIALSVYFSNSFIIEEAKILSYLLVAIILLLTYQLVQRCVRTDFKTRFRLSYFMRSIAFRLILASTLAVVLVRTSYVFFRCREEQGNCMSFDNNNTSSFTAKAPASHHTYYTTVFVIAGYVTLTRMYLRSCGNLAGNGLNVMLARYGPIVAAICACGHILLTEGVIKNVHRSHIDALALTIYALLLLHIGTMLVSPLLCHVVPAKSANSMSINPESEGIVPQLFRKMKRIYDGEAQEGRYDIPVVYGLATIYSSIIVAFSMFLMMTLVVLLESKSCLGIIICFTVGTILLIVHTILRFRTANNFETILHPNFTVTVGWFLLAHFCFFATSHQTTLSQIDWRAAFVGRTSNIGQSTIISAILVIMNTFCGQILFFSTYALLSTETFSIFALFPNLIRSNSPREPRTKLETLEARAHAHIHSGIKHGIASGLNGSGGGGGGGPQAQRPLHDISQETLGFDMTRGELALFENDTVFLGSAFKLATQFFMMQGLRVFCSMLACTIHCRHLMVWKIFAPRFIFEALATFVSLTAIIVGYLLIARAHVSIEKLITRINKLK